MAFNQVIDEEVAETYGVQAVVAAGHLLYVVLLNSIDTRVLFFVQETR
jgi:hypothetical protein